MLRVDEIVVAVGAEVDPDPLPGDPALGDGPLRGQSPGPCARSREVSSLRCYSRMSIVYASTSRLIFSSPLTSTITRLTVLVNTQGRLPG